MIDIDSHKIIDMIESRDLSAVKTWLSSYPNLAIVSRDGSITYKNTISQSHPSAIQVSDRFHILKNLTGYCKDFLKKHLNKRVIVDEISQRSKKRIKNHNIYTLKDKYELVAHEISMNMKKSNACKKYNLDIRAYNKISKFTEEERLKHFITKSEITSNDKSANKMKLVFEVRESYKKIGVITQVAKLHGLSRDTVKRYLEEDFSSIAASKGVKRKSILDPYELVIESYIKKGVKSPIILKDLRAKGYTGSSSTVRHYISDWKKENSKQSFSSKSIKYEYIDRSKLTKLLFCKVYKVKGLTKTVVEKIYTRNELFKQIIELVWAFRNLIKNQQVEYLEEWISKAKKLNISEINSFLNGILRDIDAVKNAIICNYNNGLAEGKVNKIKVTKRIMYGRSSFTLLRNKLLRLEI
jgi:transposase